MPHAWPSVEELENARREPLEYDAFLAHREVNRLTGYRRVDGRPVAWSLIEKVTEGPALAIPYLVDNAVREFRAYSSGLLDELGPGVRAPHVYAATPGGDGRLVLLLEDVAHDGPRPLDGPAVLSAARGLGTMAGRWLGRLPDEQWLFTGWIDRHGQPEASEAGAATLARRAPSVEAVLGGDRLAAGAALIEAQPRLRPVLESLPQTLCHHDAVGANVFLSGGRTTLIDWESIGPGPIGADLASLLCASVRRGDVMASVLLDVFDDAIDAYIQGAREVDASIRPADVRLGLDASIALRWKLIADIAAAVESGQDMRRGSLPGESPEQARDELVALSDVVIAAAQRVF